MKLTAPKTTEKTTKKLKFNVFNIKSLLVFNRKKLDKVKKENQRFSLFQKKKEKVKEKEEKVESPRTMGSTLKNIAGALLAKPKSIIDKFKEFFGIILLGILVNNLPRIITELQKVLGKIKEFFDNNPWIGKTIKFAFDIIAKGMMGILDLTKTLMPVIGGSFKFALDTIKTTKDEIGKLVKFFDDLGGGIGALMTSFGYKPPAKAAQSYAKSKGKYYSSTTGKTYGSYKQALKNPQVKQGAQQYANQKAQKVLAAPSRGYTPNKGTTGIGTTSKGFKQMVVAPLTTGYGANRKTEYFFKDPNNLNARPVGLEANDPGLKPSIQRYQAVSQANKVQKLSIGGTIRNFFGGMFGGSRRGLGNISPQEGTGRGSPSDIRLTSKDDGKSYAGPYTSPGGTAKGRKARETVNYFKLFENNINLQSRRLGKEEKNLDLFSEFMKSYENLSKLREKYGEQYNTPGPTPPGESGPPLISGEIYLAEGGILPSTKPGRGNRGLKGDHVYPARDYQLDVGEPISVFVPGVVHYAGNQNPNGYGNEVIIKHTNGTYTQYAHLSQISVRKGDVIESGQSRVIGKTGGAYKAPGSGNSSGPHLHFEVRDKNGNQVTQYDSGNNYFRFGGKITVKKQKPDITSGGNNEEIVRNFFRGRGLNEIAVAGILGNAKIESGFNPTIAHSESIQGKPARFIGIFQWDNKGSGDRWGSLTKFAKENNMNRESIQTQLLFTTEEMNSGSKYYDSGAGTAYQLIQKAKTPEEAAEIWRKHFERGPGKPVERMQSARKMYEKYKDKPLPRVLPVTQAQQAQTEEEIIKTMKSMGVTEKFFPQDKQRIKIVKGADGKEKIQVIDTGFLNLGVFGGELKGISPQTWKKLLNYLQYEYNKRQEEKNKPGPSAYSYGGGDETSSITIIDRPSVAVIEKTVPQLVPGPTQIVPIFISQGNSSSRSLRSNIS